MRNSFFSGAICVLHDDFDIFFFKIIFSDLSNCFFRLYLLILFFFNNFLNIFQFSLWLLRCGYLCWSLSLSEFLSFIFHLVGEIVNLGFAKDNIGISTWVFHDLWVINIKHNLLWFFDGDSSYS
jgi:hypothetical protein